MRFLLAQAFDKLRARRFQGLENNEHIVCRKLGLIKIPNRLKSQNPQKILNHSQPTHPSYLHSGFLHFRTVSVAHDKTKRNYRNKNYQERTFEAIF